MILDLFWWNVDDRDKNKFAIAFLVGDSITFRGVFLSGGLHKLLDPQVPPLQVGLWKNPHCASWVHCSNRLCSALCALGRDFDPRDSVCPRPRHCPRTYDYLLVVDSIKAGWGYWDSQWVMHFSACLILSCFDLIWFSDHFYSFIWLSLVFIFPCFSWFDQWWLLLFTLFPLFAFGIFIDSLESKWINFCTWWRELRRVFNLFSLLYIFSLFIVLF